MKKLSTTPKVFLYLSFITGLLFLSSCRKGCTDPQAINYDDDAKKNCCCEYAPTLSLKIEPVFNGQPFELNKEYTTDDGRKVSFSKTKIILSNIKLNNTDIPDQANIGHYLFSGEPVEFNIGNINPGTYTSLSFTVGVDSLTNKTKLPSNFAAGHPLADTDMHWSWATGYIFVKLEGMADTSAVPDGIVDNILLYHLGTDLTREKVTLNINKTVTGGSNDKIVVPVKIDIAEYLDGINVITENETQTMDNPALADKVAANAPKVFK